MTNVPLFPLIDYGPSVIAGAVAFVGGLWTVALKFGWIDGGGWARREKRRRRRRPLKHSLGRARDHPPDWVSTMNQLHLVARMDRNGDWAVDCWMTKRDLRNERFSVNLCTCTHGVIDETDDKAVAVQLLSHVASHLSQEPLF